MWSRVLVKIFGIKATIRGENNLPDGGCVFVFNHQSLLDIPVLAAFVKKPFRFGAKQELFKIPVFGFAMKKIGMLPIYRSNKHKALKLYSNSVDKIRSGKSYMLAPEGTRSISGDLMKFKSGPFILAIEAQAPLVPVIIKGVGKILAGKKIFANLKDTNIEIDILPSYSTRGLSKEHRHQVRENIRDKFLDVLKNNKDITLTA